MVDAKLKKSPETIQGLWILKWKIVISGIFLPSREHSGRAAEAVAFGGALMRTADWRGHWSTSGLPPRW